MSLTKRIDTTKKSFYYLEDSLWINLRDPKKQSRNSSHQVRQATLQWNFPSGNHCLAQQCQGQQRETSACRIGVPLGNGIFTYMNGCFYAKLVNLDHLPRYLLKKKQIYLKPPASYQSLYMYIYPLSSQSSFLACPPKKAIINSTVNFCQLPTVHNRYPTSTKVDGSGQI